MEVTKNPFHLTFRKPDGTVWLDGASSAAFSASENDLLTNRSATFQMAPGEQFYGLGLVLGQPLSYRGQIRSLYNDRARFQFGAMTDMAVPFVLSSKGYGLFLDNTFSQLWDFICTDGTNWRATVTGGELDYYFIGADGLADALDRYTQITGRSPLPPRWALGYMQSRYGYRNWSQMYAARDAFRSNDLPCDTLILDLYWWGRANQMGALTWNPTNFPDASSNLTALAASGIKVINIHEEYVNRDNPPAKANFDQAAAQHYLVSTNEEMTAPSLLESEGFFDTAGYVDFLNPDARRWWFTKIKPLVDDGIAGFWTDLGEPEQDRRSDYLYGGRRESEIHNVYNLLWHQALADGFATYYPNRRLYILSRSGFRRRPALRRRTLDQRHALELANARRSPERAVQLWVVGHELFWQRHWRIHRPAEPGVVCPLVSVRRLLPRVPRPRRGSETHRALRIRPAGAGALPHHAETAVSVAAVYLHDGAGDLRHGDADVSRLAAGFPTRYERRPQRNAIHVRAEHPGRARHHPGHDLTFHLPPLRILDRPVERTIRHRAGDDQLARAADTNPGLLS